MPYTSCKVHMEFIDTSAAEDCTAMSTDNASIGNLMLLKQKGEFPQYAIPDLNGFVLDGSKAIMEDAVEVPFISNEIAEDNGMFGFHQVLTLNFDEPHTSAGITLCFVMDYPVEIKISWYDLSGTLLSKKIFYPDNITYFCDNQVTDYGKIVIEFIKTRFPGQRIQLYSIVYGREIEWTDERIKAAAVNEEVDITGATLPINTGDVSIVDTDNEFELSNQEGTWKSIQKKQKLTITEEVGIKDVVCGVLYIDKWQSTGNVVRFSLVDKIGLIDKTKFYNGKIYTDVEAGIIIADIMTSAGVEDYSVSEEVASILLTGYLPICTHREALQQVIFACGSVATCSRDGQIKIFMPDRYAGRTIGTGRKFLGTTIELDEYVSGVSIEYSRYKLNSDLVEIFDDLLPAGDSLIEFADPYTDITVSTGVILEANYNYVKVHMDESAQCVISGRKYESTKVTYTVSVKILEAGEEENIQSYSGCTLFNASRVKEVAERILNYYQLRQIVTMRYLIDSEKAGDWVNIADTSGNIVTSGLVSQNIDLTGGYIATATCRGYSILKTDFVYSSEIYAGERGLI